MKRCLLFRKRRASRKEPDSTHRRSATHVLSREDENQALEILGEYEREEKRSYVSPYNIAAVYVGLNERDKALEYLEKAFEERTCALAFVKVEPLWDPIRPDPRFQDLLRRMNFPE